AARPAVDHLRGGPVARQTGAGRRQALHPGAETAEGHPRSHARRTGGAPPMNDPGSGSDLLAGLADEFAERFRRGERPALTEYADRYPELADRIRDLFPALVAMEQFGSVGGATGSFA